MGYYMKYYEAIKGTLYGVLCESATPHDIATLGDKYFWPLQNV